ncbi:glycoside hydrolase family 6 protein [Euzebya sp.]|uniref:glycoside hydrolase family 6 protein n=1 Tax=Euzebya sp. TaxID=1971409 RepID=UPI0035169F64
MPRLAARLLVAVVAVMALASPAVALPWPGHYVRGGEVAPPPGPALLVAAGGVQPAPTQARAWVAGNPDDPRRPVIAQAIADVPTAMWLNGAADDAARLGDLIAAGEGEGRLPVAVMYHIPGRDCGRYSAGGAGGSDAYRKWVDGLVAAIGDSPVLVVVEPDALAQLDCVPEDLREDRLALLRHAVSALSAAPVAWAYLDAGHSDWHPPSVMADRLLAAGVADAHGFTTNVSNHQTTADERAYAAGVDAHLVEALGTSRAHAIDTGRNGNGSDGEWCNAAGRAIGAGPQVAPEHPDELWLWIKPPGESDGDCGIGRGTTAGQFVPDIAVELAAG